MILDLTPVFAAFTGVLGATGPTECDEWHSGPVPSSPADRGRGEYESLLDVMRGVHLVARLGDAGPATGLDRVTGRGW